MTTVLGILGAAGIAPSAVLRPAARRDDVVVGAVAARRGARAYADRFGIERAYDGYDGLLADPAVDLVYNALPPSLHARWTIAALEAGKHVLCEKPFTLDAAEAEQVVAVAERTGRRVVEAFHDHYHPLSSWVRDFLAGPGVGTVHRVEAVFTGATPFDPASIRHDPALGGGALMDLGCYPVHWVRTALRCEPEVRAARAVLNPLGADLEIEADLELPDGAPVRLHASMAEGVPLASTLTVEGDRGVLHVENVVFPARGHSIRTEVDGLTRVRTVAGEETYDHQLAAVLEALATGAPLPTEGADPVANMRVIDAVYAAAGMRG
ncbi:MAG: Gfo/Idh/MocA family protein [Janthinobacterium lividum]